MPGIVKIGKTTRSIEERVAELATTGVPDAFEVIILAPTSDVDQVENYIHMELAELRVNNSREFFRWHKDTVEKLFIEVMTQWPIPLPGNVHSAERIFEEKLLLATEKIRASYEKRLEEEIQKAFQKGKESMWSFHIRERNSLAHGFANGMRKHIISEIERSKQNEQSGGYIDGLKYALEAIAW